MALNLCRFCQNAAENDGIKIKFKRKGGVKFYCAVQKFHQI
ncbi:hypothetical protein [Campylobacter showae]|nr:hypothetical protein [Campylobacter showae]